MGQDERYMHRALQLARLGEGRVFPNPMVGAVIVYDGKIIGEGFHRRWGGPHAEVNAVESVENKDLLRHSSIYVTLEPCSHYGKTPPCAELLIRSGFSRVVIGTLDPFEKVSGKGVEMLLRAGVEVKTGVLESECRELNRKFMLAHSLRRPYILLKWAQSSDGYISATDGRPVRFSNPLSQMWVHRERSLYDAIMVGTNTVITDNPKLTVRDWHGRDPRCVTFNCHGHLPCDSYIACRSDSIIITDKESITKTLSRLYSEYGITSVMVEGGAKLLQSFIDADLYDEIRVEISPLPLGKGVAAPTLNRENFLYEMIRTNKIVLNRR